MNNFSATVFSHVHSGKDVKQLGETLKQISTNRSSKAVEIQGETDRKESGVRLLDALVLNRMGNDDAKALAKALENNTRICYLGLYDHCIGDKGSTAIARALQRATQLVSLNLAENPLSSAAVRALLAPKTLRRLSLTRCTLIGEDIVAVAKVLEHDSNLQSIDLSTCGIDDAGVAALCASLAINSTLQCLSLNYNRFDAAGYVALAELMRSNTTIASLHVDQKKFQSESEDGLKALMDSLASRTNLIALDLSALKTSLIEPLCSIVKGNSSLRMLHIRSDGWDAVALEPFLRCVTAGVPQLLSLENLAAVRLDLSDKCANDFCRLFVEKRLTHLHFEVYIDMYQKLAIRKLSEACERNITITQACWATNVRELRSVARVFLMRNRRYAWSSVHREILNVCIAMMPLGLPIYVLLWIVEWLQPSWLASHNIQRKVDLIKGIRDTMARIKGLPIDQ